MEANGIKVVNINDEMKTSFMDYAMSVIISRALPDVRDGLKPVHRRILFAMNDLGNTHNKPFKKSARIVGDVIGKYHPHGDTPVYDAIVRMAQDFSMRYPLIDGQGNFGSIDGDSPAAMRYTEIRLAKISEELLADIDKDTVDFVPNYDESLKEPVVLPSKIPNLLINGSSGIAVGMSTNIPPHSLEEVIDGIVHLIDNPSATVEDLMKFIKGPDFPTGAYIYGRKGIIEAYKTGKGIIKIRGKAFIEGDKKKSIVIKEIPYQLNKAKLIEAIANLVKDKKIEGISDIRDESDRDGMRIVIELKRDSNPEIVLNNLYKKTSLQMSFGIILLAIVNRQPKLLDLKSFLHYFIQHRREVVTRRTKFELNKARNRAHILEGLKIALSNIDRVIAIIKASKTPALARENLIKEFSFSEVQAQAILDMKLQRLTNLEREKLLEEYKKLLMLIEELESILGSEKKLLNVIKNELIEIKNKYGDGRRTEILDETDEITLKDTIPDEDSVITITHKGYIKRTPVKNYQSQKKGGKGRRGTSFVEDDFLEDVFVASNHSYLMIFTDKGKVYLFNVYEIPEREISSRGVGIRRIVNIDPNEQIRTIMPLKNLEEKGFLVFGTKNGYVKKSDIKLFSNIRANGIFAIEIADNDELIGVRKSNGEMDIFLSTRNGLSIRFDEHQVRPTGRRTRGVIGINLSKDDEVISFDLVDKEGDILTVTEKGYGKRTPIEKYRRQHRSGKGIINMRVSPKIGKVVGVKYIKEEGEIFFVTKNGKILLTTSDSLKKTEGRNTMGGRVIRLDEGDMLASFSFLPYRD